MTTIRIKEDNVTARDLLLAKAGAFKVSVCIATGSPKGKRDYTVHSKKEFGINEFLCWCETQKRHIRIVKAL